MTQGDEKDEAQGASPPAVAAVLEIDRVVHEPARLVILAILDSAEEVDFRFLSAASGLTKGNLSRQTTNLADAGYIAIRKYYKGRIPATGYQITERGRAALQAYWATMAALQQGRTPVPPPEAAPGTAEA
ncbi:MAG TPA: transcriptional regulator [Roseiflexaceae bacterium]|nr:transcriptional regulator [Roseiflexaceae bacterium]